MSKKGRREPAEKPSSSQWWQVLLPVQITYTSCERYRYERLFKHVQADSEREAIAIAQRMLSKTQTLIDTARAWPRSAEVMTRSADKAPAHEGRDDHAVAG